MPPPINPAWTAAAIRLVAAILALGVGVVVLALEWTGLGLIPVLLVLLLIAHRPTPPPPQQTEQELIAELVEIRWRVHRLAEQRERREARGENTNP